MTKDKGSMTTEIELFEEMARWPIFDPHTHIDPHRPAARHFDEVLGYHYYTELAHSAGMPADRVAPELDPEARARNLAEWLERIDSGVGCPMCYRCNSPAARAGWPRRSG